MLLLGATVHQVQFLASYMRRAVTPLFHQARLEEAKQLFRNHETTEFVVVAIPTIMAAAESARLAAALQQEGVPVKTIVINQVRILLPSRVGL
jgi:anion-transporting  ArsA/GET3 family ATPase